MESRHRNHGAPPPNTRMSEIIESGLNLPEMRLQIETYLKGNKQAEKLKKETFEKHKLKTAGFLGGGAWYSLQHIGALEKAEEEGIEFDELIGSSGGALVGTIYKIDRKKLRDRDRVRGFTGSFRLAPSLRSTHDERVLRRNINNCIDGATFADCKGLHIVVTDVTHHRTLILNEKNYKGKLIDAVMASAAIPGVFKPYYMRQLPDGTFDWADENEYYPGSDVFMVQDGSLGADMPVQTMKAMDPSIYLSVGIQTIPGAHQIDKMHQGFRNMVQQGAQWIHQGRESMKKIVPHESRIQGVHGMKGLGGTIPAALAHTLATFAFGTQFHKSYGQLDPEKREFLIRPKPKRLVNPIGQPSFDDQDAMIEAGRESMDHALETLPILEHVMSIDLHNEQLGKILNLREGVQKIAAYA